jgi:hypothetical protein
MITSQEQWRLARCLQLPKATSSSLRISYLIDGSNMAHTAHDIGVLLEIQVIAARAPVSTSSAGNANVANRGE